MKRHPLLPVVALLAVLLGSAAPRADAAPLDSLVEASISDIHAAIRSGDLTCVDVVEGYLARARAYNGPCTWLVTADGAPVADVPGAVRAGVPVDFPTATVPVSNVLPDLDQYAGLPLEFGEMLATVSDPTVYQQYGMRVGIPDAGQVNALETFNLRGERTVACKGSCDAPPSQPLPEGCPAVCDVFRRQPDALERAAELDAQYGSSPPTAELPMYCIPVAIKDPYDTKDMRTTSNADVAFAMDAPPFDSTIAAQFRAKGAILYAKATAHEFNAGPGNPGGPAAATTYFPSGVSAISGWGGQACNPYDTEREPRGSSSGVGAAISANLAVIGICEQSGASCQGPASRNGVALILPTAGILPGSGGIGNQFFIDRPGIHGRTIADAAIALDAVKDPASRFFDPTTIYTAIPEVYVPEASYASFVVTPEDLAANPRPLAGKRVAVVREWMVKHTPNDAEISDKIDAEVKSVLRDQLGADLVETIDPDYPDDPTVANVTFGFQDAMAEILPQLRPNVFTRTSGSNQFYGVPGYDVTSYGYLLDLSLGLVPASANLNLRNMTGGTAASLNVKFGLDRYLVQRGDPKITDWAAWVANSRFRQDSSRAGAENWITTTTNIADGNREALARSVVGQMIVLKVMLENDIDLFVMPENTLPPRRIGRASAPTVKGRGAVSGASGLFTQLELPVLAVPAGFVETEYEPQFALSSNKQTYTGVNGATATPLPEPMPISMLFWGGPGDDATLIAAASAYQSASQRRVPPPDFGPVPDEL